MRQLAPLPAPRCASPSPGRTLLHFVVVRFWFGITKRSRPRLDPDPKIANRRTGNHLRDWFYNLALHFLELVEYARLLEAREILDEYPAFEVIHFMLDTYR